MTPEIALRPIAPIEPARLQPREAGDALEAPAAPAVVSPVTPNPRLRLDGSLGMVVIEFRDQAGSVANSIPSPRVIEAYRAAAITDAPMPIGVRAPGQQTAVAAAEPAAPAPAPAASPAPAATPAASGSA
ncbi:hypothetical protein J5Y09_23510 [Roseomonas sp. PWR1]|uniref:Uncharacterized protein n=1 Tax=Roseomonas nitratireducens TaxID=2820810 RepID=A0ABS4B1L7_9PROT|nr:hypothetical protein [Neoroseomonas nitratireducens]MBP0466916.1 hypothetical protein [Neoroseomonas nitratireducens]